MSERKVNLNEEQCWQAVQDRDAASDGVFIFAVKTTGIYCRPSCPARRPKRENVRFFALNREAEAAGFRACRRCCPTEMSKDQRHNTAIEAICRLIETRLAAGERAPKLDELMALTGLSKFYVQRLFKARMGMTPSAYAIAKADERLRAQLQEGSGVLAAAVDTGRSGTAQFYARASQILGMAPSDYRQGGRRQNLWYAYAETGLGLMMVAGTIAGVSSIRFGESKSALLTELRALFAKAELVEAGAAMADEIDEIVRHIELPEQAMDLPLDIQGTAFQQQVWQALSAIALGEIRTYSEIATAIGAPSASRAVANACGANPLAVVVPCHRVVRGDGTLGGYRWGIERKRQLLAREGLDV